MQCEVCISVLNWNGWQDTLTCLDSLLPLLDITPAKLVVCDNASEDDSWQHLKTWAQQHFSESFQIIDMQTLSPSHPAENALCTLLRTPHNAGFAAGHNAVLRHILPLSHVGYFWLLNNDLTVAPDALRALLKCAAIQTQTGLFGSSVFDAATPEILQCAGGCHYYPWLTLFRPLGSGKHLAEVACPQRVDYVYGAAMFIRRSCFDHVGLLNEEYFLFYEELDFAQRIQKLGYTLAWCRDSHVWHQGSASIGTPAQGDRAKLRHANYYENLSTLKYTARFHPYIFPLAAFLRLVLKALAVSLRGEYFLLSPLWRAYRDYLLFLFKNRLSAMHLSRDKEKHRTP